MVMTSMMTIISMGANITVTVSALKNDDTNTMIVRTLGPEHHRRRRDLDLTFTMSE